MKDNNFFFFKKFQVVIGIEINCYYFYSTIKLMDWKNNPRINTTIYANNNEKEKMQCYRNERNDKEKAILEGHISITYNILAVLSLKVTLVVVMWCLLRILIHQY